MERCCRCLIKAESLDLDSSAVCSYCRIVDKFSNIILKIGKHQTLLRKRLSLFRNRGEYDCLVGLSGGKDSSYMIYRLKTHYGARILAYTCDNGFLTEYAKKNIDVIVREFDIDHIWVRPKYKLLRAMYAKNLANECWPCSACFLIAESSAWKLAYENRIPYIVSGREPEQVLRKPDVEDFESPNSIIADNFAPYDKNRVHKLAASTIQRSEEAKKWLIPDQRLWPLASDELYLKSDFSMPKDFDPEFLLFFLYEKHNVPDMVSILENKSHWQNSKSHADCAAHDAAAYLYYHRHGTTFLGLEISALIRHNKLSQKEGKRILDEEVDNLLVYPKDSILALSELSGIRPFNIRLLPMQLKARSYLKNRIRKLNLRKRLYTH